MVMPLSEHRKNKIIKPLFVMWNTQEAFQVPAVSSLCAGEEVQEKAM